MAGPKIAKSTAANGPDDKLIVVDVYGESGSEVANDYQETHPESVDVLDGLDGANNSDGLKDDAPWEEIDDTGGLEQFTVNNDVSDLVDDYDFDSDVVSQAELDEWLASGDYELIGDMNNLSDKLKNSFREGLNGLDQIYADFNGTVSKITGAVDPRSMNALTSLINKTGCGEYNPNISYRGSSTSFLSGLINAASRLGLPGAFSSIMNCISDPNVVSGVLGNVLPRMASQANIPLLNDIANSNVARDVIGIMPNVVSQTVGKLGRPTGLQQNQYSDYYGKARQSFNTVDPNWNSAVRYDNGRSLDATVVSSNPFFNDTLKSSVMSTPVQVLINTVAGSGNAANVTYGQSPYPPQKGEVESEQAYSDRVAAERSSDAMMCIASSLPKQDVNSALYKSFSNVGVKTNRSIGFI